MRKTGKCHVSISISIDDLQVEGNKTRARMTCFIVGPFHCTPLFFYIFRTKCNENAAGNATAIRAEELKAGNRPQRDCWFERKCRMDLLYVTYCIPALCMFHWLPGHVMDPTRQPVSPAAAEILKQE